MRILITGGTGFVGRWMQKFGTIKTGPPYLWPFLGEFFLYISSRNNYTEVLKQDYDYIVHLAPVPVDDVIECASRTNARILYSSSGAVYDKHPDEYGLAKLEGERKLLASGLDVRIARMFSFIGDGLPKHLAPAQMVASAKRYGIIQASQSVRSYMDAQDMAAWMWAILFRGKPWTIYNVGSPEPCNMAKLAVEISKHFRASLVEFNGALGPRPHYVPDVSQTIKDLGVGFTVTFEESVDRFVRSYK